MPRTALKLAALATVAVPALDATGVRVASRPLADCDVADVSDASGELWTIRAPLSGDAAERMEREVTVWDALSRSRFGLQTVAVPTVAGFTDLDEHGRCIVYQRPSGQPVDVDGLTPGSTLLHQIVNTIATLHTVPTVDFAALGVPVFSSEEYRAARLEEVRKAAGTGSVPQNLQARWTSALESHLMWEFVPSVIHGDLVADHVLVESGALTTITGWTETRIADPADDLAWLLTGADEDVADEALDAYRDATGSMDEYLLDRSYLAGELSLVRWLLHGMAVDDMEIIAAARRMMRELDGDITAGEYG